MGARIGAYMRQGYLAHVGVCSRTCGGAGGGGRAREEADDVLLAEERVGRREDGVVKVMSSTREAALRRAQVAEEERELRERLRRFNCEADALDAQVLSGASRFTS